MNRRAFLKLPPSILISSAISFEALSVDDDSFEELTRSHHRLNKRFLNELGIQPPKTQFTLPSDESITLFQQPSVIRKYNDLIYVNYELDNGIYVYSLKGKYIDYIGFSTELVPIKDFAIDSQNQLIYMVERAKHHIEVYDLAGEKLLRISEFGIELDSQLNGPSSITVDSQGRLHVLEAITSKIKVFENNGSYVFSYTKSNFNRKLKLKYIDGYNKIVATSKGDFGVKWFFDDDLRALTIL